uniref:Tbc-20 n=1 Tax=Pristionchus pacificus TaxID=54126 RepID=A0A2A6CCN9_PRIPA|eukprot:PDM75877.1 tbc-20 [Pristionchus pacificus]
MSISEPCSPSKSFELVDEKWLAVSSCVDLADQNGDNHSDPLFIARLSSTNRKKRTIDAFLSDFEGKLDDHIENLRTFARSTGGLIDDDIRRIVWPVLARNLYKYDHEGPSEPELDDLTDDEANTHKEWNQVQLDVHRTLARFPPNIDKDERDDLQIVRVFDAFLASDPLLPIYFSAACILYRRSEIFATEREMPFLHHLLGTLPKNLPIDSLISDALYLTKLIPPLLLKGKYLKSYKETGPPISNIAPVVSSISRYAIQAVFVAGAMSAAAVTYFLSRSAL